jgi:pimeloyl-ACP methyl ester carboxylesterase
MTACAPVSTPSTDAADRFLLVEGTRLRYRDEGHGAAVLLVHGWTLDLEMWNPQVRALGAAFRLVRLDRRGHGRSGGVPTAERDRADLEALCTHLQLGRVALLGMSQGVRSVLEFARAAPHRVAALLLDGPPALDSGPDLDVPLQHYVALLRARGVEAFRAEWSEHPLMQLRTRNAEVRALLAAMIARYSGNDLNPAAAEPERAAERLPLEALRIPTLVLSGEHDSPGRRDAARQLAARLPQAELAVVPMAGHLSNLDNPDRYSTLCREFLTRHCARDTS